MMGVIVLAPLLAQGQVRDSTRTDTDSLRVYTLGGAIIIRAQPYAESTGEAAVRRNRE